MPGPVSDSYQGPPDLEAIPYEPSMPWGIQVLVNENRQLRAALIQMVEEKCDYMRINNLGDPETQHTVKAARAALKQT